MSSETHLARGCGLILYDEASRRLLFTLRDDIPSIRFPGHLDLIGGHCEAGETAHNALVRECREELVWARTGEPYILSQHRHYRTYIDAWGTTQDIFSKHIDFDTDDITLLEGQRLVWVPIEELKATTLAFGFNTVVEDFCKEQFGSI